MKRSTGSLLVSALPGAVVTAALLFAFGLVADDDGPPPCPVSRTGGVDLVPAGARPCVLHAPAVPYVDAGPGRGIVSDGSKRTAPPVSGGTGGRGRQPAAPPAPAPKAPAAPPLVKVPAPAAKR